MQADDQHVKPRGWSPKYDASGWHARLPPNRGHYIGLLLFAVVYIVSMYQGSFIDSLASLALFAAFAVVTRLLEAAFTPKERGTWLFDLRATDLWIDHRVLRASGAKKFEVALDEIQDVRPFRMKGLSQVDIHRVDGTVTSIAVWRSPREIAFICDAVKAAVAARGQDPNAGYRGTLPRAGSLETSGAEEAEEALHNDESRARDSAEK